MNLEPTDKIEKAIKSLEQFLKNSPEYYHEEGDLIVLLVEELRRLFETSKGGIGLVHVEVGLIKGGKRHDIVIFDDESLRQAPQDSAWLSGLSAEKGK